MPNRRQYTASTTAYRHGRRDGYQLAAAYLAAICYLRPNLWHHYITAPKHQDTGNTANILNTATSANTDPDQPLPDNMTPDTENAYNDGLWTGARIALRTARGTIPGQLTIHGARNDHDAQMLRQIHQDRQLQIS